MFCNTLFTLDKTEVLFWTLSKARWRENTFAVIGRKYPEDILRLQPQHINSEGHACVPESWGWNLGQENGGAAVFFLSWVHLPHHQGRRSSERFTPSPTFFPWPQTKFRMTYTWLQIVTTPNSHFLMSYFALCGKVSCCNCTDRQSLGRHRDDTQRSLPSASRVSCPPKKEPKTRIKQGFGREFSIIANSGMSPHLTCVRGTGRIFWLLFLWTSFNGEEDYLWFKVGNSRNGSEFPGFILLFVFWDYIIWSLMYLFIYFLVGEGHAYHSADLEVRDNLMDVGSFLPPCQS